MEYLQHDYILTLHAHFSLFCKVSSLEDGPSGRISSLGNAKGWSLWCSTVSNTFNVYQAFNFKEIKNLFMVSARFCEMYFILQELLYTSKHDFSMTYVM